MFKFYEPVYYHQTSSFPDSAERLGYWVGAAHNVGDALCHCILDAQTMKFHETSTVRPVNTKNPNFRIGVPGSTLPVTAENSKTLNDPTVTNAPPFALFSVKLPITTTTVTRPDLVHDPGELDPLAISQDQGEVPLPSTSSSMPESCNANPSNAMNGRRNTQSNTRRTRSNGNRQRYTGMCNLFRLFNSMTEYFNHPDTIPRANTAPWFYSHERPDFETTLLSPFDEEEVDYLRAKVNQDVHLNNMNMEEMKIFRYTKLCETFTDDEHDEEELTWTPVMIDKFLLRKKNPDDVHVRIRIVWLNGTRSWTRLSDFQMEHPDMVVNFALENDLTNHWAFKWTKLYIKIRDLEKKSSIFSDSNEAQAILATRYDPQGKYKFGVEVPYNTRHALRLDSQNGNDLWKKAIQKELDEINGMKVFRKVTPEDDLSTYQRIGYHIVYDAKFDGRRKARLVCQGNMTDPPKEDIYSGVVSLDTVRLGFQIAEMSNLQTCAADVSTAFLYGTTNERIYIVAGKEFGELAGQPLIVQQGIYGLRSSAARFHEHLAAEIRKLGFRPSKIDPDLYIREQKDHYEYLATYVDDVLVFSKNPMKIIDALKKTYVLKGVGIPEYYLGGNVEKPIDEHWDKLGITTALSAETYITNAIDRFKKLLEINQFGKETLPMAPGDHPELDDSPLCSPDQASKYRSLLGSANWIITLGRFDIAFSVQSLARFGMAPRVGHYKRMIRVFAYLNNRRTPPGRLICDNSYPDHSKYVTNKHNNWIDFYPDAEEELPPDMPNQYGNPARITCYVDADHAHCKQTRRSITGVVLFVNNMPVRWISKRQKTVETSTYGSELVAARIATDLIIEMRYTLRMLGVPVEKESLLIGDNMSVVLNCTLPSSQLKKKHNAIAYHRVREAVASGIVRFAHIDSKENIADIMTKSVDKATFYHLTKKCLFRVANKSETPK